MVAFTRSQAADLAYEWSEPYLELNEETLRRLERNNPGVAHLRIDDSQVFEGVGRAISGNIYLFKLDIVFSSPLGENPFLDEVCRGLALNRSVQWLTLTINVNWNCFKVDIFHMLSPFFERNHKLFVLEIKKLDVCSPQFRSLPSALKKCKNLECARFDELRGHGEGASLIFDALQNAHKLSALYYLNSPIDNYDCMKLASLLYRPDSQMVELVMENNDLDEDGMAAISQAIRTSTSLMKVQCSWNECQTDEPWCYFSSIVLGTRFCDLDIVVLSGNNIGDEGVTCLGNALAINKSVEVLDISSNASITIAGWIAFSKCLRRSHSVLRNLDITDCGVDEESVVTIARALRGNECLEKLTFDVDDFTVRMWTMFSDVLCDKSSIKNTYMSNHTLSDLKFSILNEDVVLDTPLILGKAFDVRMSLLMNVYDDKSQVARRKILKHHFPDREDNIGLFAHMPQQLLPFVMGWIGLDDLGYTLMYKLVRGLPENYN